MKYESKKLTRHICMALSAAALALPMTAYAAESADEEAVYDLDTVEVVGQRPVSQPVEPPAEETPNVYAGGQIARESTLGVLGKRDFMDVPFNVTTFNSDMIENQQASSVVDVITNDASISDQTLSGASQAWYIRGFKAQQQDVQFNGLYGVAPRFYAGVEYLERVQLLKGPAALLGGMAPNGSVGGTINFIPKRAGQEPKTSVILSYGNGHQFAQHIDIGRRSADGKLGVRVNILNSKGDTSVTDEGIQTSTQSVALDYNNGRNRASFDFGFVYNKIENPQYRVTFDSSFLANAGGMLRVGIDSKFGSKGTYRSISEKYGVFRGEHDFNKDWTGYISFGMRNTGMDYLYNEFRLDAGDGTSKVTYRYNNQINKANSLELGVRGTVETKNLKHELTLAANRMHYTRYMYNRVLNNYDTNIYNPTWGTPRAMNARRDLTWRTPKNDATTLTSIALSDVMTTADKRWTFVLGGRFQQIDSETYALTLATGRAQNYSHYDKSKFSPAFGVVHKLNDKTSIYANYIEGLNQGDEAGSDAVNVGEQMSPYVAKQYEVGAKFDFGSIATTLSAFTITNPSMITDPVTKIAAANGEVRNRGIELNVFGEPRKGTRLNGGMTWLDARYQRTAGGTNDGHRKEGAPRFTAVFGVEQDIHGVEGLSVSTHMVYNSMTYANAANTFRVSPWVRWDMGARYKFNAGDTPVTVRADVYNLFNKNYWRGLENAVYLGTGRTFMLSVTADF